jgi:hypothetical protein
MGGEPTAGHHCPNGGAFSIARRAMQQIATAEGQTIFAEPGLPFKERLKIVSEQREDALVKHQVIPGTAHNSARSPTQDMETRLAVASIDLFHEPNHLFGTLPPSNQEVRYAFTIAAQTPMVVDI